MCLVRPGSVRRIFSVKRSALTPAPGSRAGVSRATNRPSTLLTLDTQVYFRDIYDHILRINDALETYRELLSNTLDSYLTQVSNRLGSITKTLSVVATITLPFIIVSGMWGMNFERIPLSHTAHGFWTMLVVHRARRYLLIGLKWRRLL